MPPDAPQRGGLEALRQLSEGLLRSAVRTGVRGNLLELHHPGAPLFDPLLLHSATHGYGVSISLRQDDRSGNGNGNGKGNGNGHGQHVRCRSAQLPFQDGVFNMVVLHHVIGHGDEPELAEAVRVLARNGVLLLLGLNRMGWRYRAQDGSPRLPGLAPLKVKSRLDAIDMVMQGFAGAGLAGRQRPAFLNDGLLGLATPFADLVLLQAHHRGSPGVTPLRFRKPRSAVVQSAPIRG
ncbi:MAG: methyltransferase domain-containing protein [Xanthomonadales bacterium]|nr:methyltransferase domain-containing protein [Xanthomonadales bacterium]